MIRASHGGENPDRTKNDNRKVASQIALDNGPTAGRETEASALSPKAPPSALTRKRLPCDAEFAAVSESVTKIISYRSPARWDLGDDRLVLGR